VTWQVYCPECGHMTQHLPRCKAEFYAALHRASHGHRVLVHGQGKATEGRVAVGKLA